MAKPLSSKHGKGSAITLTRRVRAGQNKIIIEGILEIQVIRISKDKCLLRFMNLTGHNCKVVRGEL